MALRWNVVTAWSPASLPLLQEDLQLSVSEESEMSASRACRFRTFQCRHCARLSNQSYTRSWQQMDGTG